MADLEEPPMDSVEQVMKGLTSEEAAELIADAERWRAFISSDRFYVMGWAGFTNSRTDPQVRKNWDDWLHFTLNVWDKHPAGNDEQGVHGRALLLAYVEHLREVRARLLSSGGEG